MSQTPAFRYEGWQADPERGLLTCHYSLGRWRFREKITFGRGGSWDPPAAQAARLIFLLAGVSYYKTAAPPVIDLGETPVTDTERGFLHTFYLDGLGEFGYRNGLDLSGLRIVGGRPGGTPASPGAIRGSGCGGRPTDTPVSGTRDTDAAANGAAAGTAATSAAHTGAAAGTAATPAAHTGAILIPFGGGIDSIVTVESMRARAEAALFIMSRPGDRFEAIERPAAVTGLPIVRAEREIDPKLLRGAESGFLNGHVPITGILSAIAVMAAVLGGRDTVVMSNEWSASVATLEAGGRPINHQYSKSADFEAAFRKVLAGTLGGTLNYFSALRPFTELWIACKFAALTQYHATFRSCNRAFHIDPARRLDHWCGRCDKCCFIDLILAPFLPAADLEQIFAGREPLADPSLAGQFRTLLGTSRHPRPFECVGETGECQAAAVLAANRPDRAGTPLLATLVAELPDPPGPAAVARLLRPVGEHFIPDAYAAGDLLV